MTREYPDRACYIDLLFERIGRKYCPNIVLSEYYNSAFIYFLHNLIPLKIMHSEIIQHYLIHIEPGYMYYTAFGWPVVADWATTRSVLLHLYIHVQQM